MKTNSTPELTPKKSLRCTLPVGLASLCLLAASIVPASALYIDFEPPTYTSGALLDGQGGWVAGSQYYVNTPAIEGTASAVVYAAIGERATYGIAAEDLGEMTSVMALIRPNNPAIHGESYAQGVLVLSNASNINYLGILADQDGVFRYLNVGATEWLNTSLTFSYDDVLSVSATLNFSTQTFDLVATNLTTSSSISLTSLGFSNPTNLARAAGGLFVLGGSSASYDNLSVQAVPEPSTNVLFGLAAIGVALVLIRRRNQARVA